MPGQPIIPRYSGLLDKQTASLPAAGPITQLVDAAPLAAEVAELRERIAGLTARLTEALATAGTSPAYLPLCKLAAHFGLSTRQTQEVCIAAQKAGRLDTIAPAAEVGTPRVLYSVADFRAWGKEHLSATRRKPRQGKKL